MISNHCIYCPQCSIHRILEKQKRALQSNGTYMADRCRAFSIQISKDLRQKRFRQKRFPSKSLIMPRRKTTPRDWFCHHQELTAQTVISTLAGLYTHHFFLWQSSINAPRQVLSGLDGPDPMVRRIPNQHSSQTSQQQTLTSNTWGHRTRIRAGTA